MRLVLVLRSGEQRDLQSVLRGGVVVRPELVPPGFDVRAQALALLGQDPRSTWSGPASYELAAAGAHQAEDETAYLLTPVRVVGETIEQSVRLGRGRVLDLVEWLREDELIGEAVQLIPADPPLLLVAEAYTGAPPMAAAELAGRGIDDLPAGPPAVLRRVIEGARRGLLEVGGPATHLFPNTPSGQSRVQPLRETWLGLGPSAVVGDGADALALGQLLGLSHVPLDSGGLGLREALHDVANKDLVVVLLSDAQAEAFGDVGKALPDVPGLAVAWPQDAAGKLPLIWLSREGAELGDGVDLLEPLALRA